MREIGIPVLLEDTRETPGTSSNQPLTEVKPEPTEDTVEHEQLPSEEITLDTALTQGEHDNQELLQDTEMLHQAIATHAGGSDSSGDLAGMD